MAAIAGIALTAAAGNWQLDRAHEKDRLQQAYDRAAALLLGVLVMLNFAAYSPSSLR